MAAWNGSLERGPKSAILTVYVGGVDGGVTRAEYRRNEFVVSWWLDVDTRMFSGLMSRWKKLWACMCSRPCIIWNKMLLTLALSRHLWSLAFISWYRLPSMYSMQMCSFLLKGSRKMSREGTRWWWAGVFSGRRLPRSSRQGVKDSNDFFMVLMAI